MTKNVLISGAGIAGPALALALGRHGFGVTVVEVAPHLRTSGFAVDFRGPTHLGVLERLGVLDELRELQTHGSAMSVVDEAGREIFRLPPEFTGGELEVLRSDLSATLMRHSAPTTEYLFGDAITGLTETPDGVHVEFRHAAARTFDIVVGADGMHSAVRRLRFGPEQDFVKHLDYYIAGWAVPTTSTDAQHYGVPGKLASVGAGNAMIVFAAPELPVDLHDLAQQKDLISSVYHGLGWRVPEMLAALRDAPEIYFDSISRVSAPAWTTNRVALLGDAAWGVTLGGMGVGTGLVGAYVLAGELAGGRPLSAYEAHMRPYAGRWQKHAHPGRFLAPRTRHGLWLRNRLFSTALVRKSLLLSTDSFAKDPALPTYA
ncbi:FAD-dependent monooxygenase [Cryptosporangium sp. NPDC048952]|uniref:FAD-dependent monooxygenase n=1 Tax=Cryptosporangium sp. NPDC048952 TaxID=3363961 RepID=UPI0037200691